MSSMEYQYKAYFESCKTSMIELFGGDNQRQLTAFSLVSVLAKKLSYKFDRVPNTFWQRINSNNKNIFILSNSL